MKYLNILQGSQEWWEYKVFKVSGTRFGKLISNRENGLIDELVDEKLNGCCDIGDYESEDMIFGIENEPIAIDLYEKQTGIKFKRGGVIASDISEMHMASPDGINEEMGIVLEVKCTMHGKKQINRFRKGVESDKIGQIINYFAVSNDVKEVHWVSYCPYRRERPLVIYIFKRDTVVERKELKSGVVETTVQDFVLLGQNRLCVLEREAKELIINFTKIEF